ncbi:asparagine synthase (glutamine-hydrolyzing) [Candidatus Pacearchaeota archaeon]|nr:asparagine synthase (glutamine-hydrolyzing) [Candidatus Pacearchaeota archaeon]
MCGITGFNWDDSVLLKKILKKINHRGPDGFGTFLDGKVSLGHKRLSILDLSSNGKQPMSNEDGTIWITFNGEIYNFLELKKNLLEKGHVFKSESDTEVIIHLYEEEGVNCIKKLNGMFAFCIYDLKSKKLFLARDRFGIKPLYYSLKNKNFIFCSEIKGILESPLFFKQIDLSPLNYFLSFRANTSENSFFSEIKKLLPGNYLIFDLISKKIILKKNYWALSFSQENLSFSYFSSKLKEDLERSVRQQMVSDVPYGAFLSGGVDSGTIVSLMSQFSEKPVETFSVGFNNSYDELNEAKYLSEKFGTNHHELIINQNSIKSLPEIIYHLDEPMSDPTSIPTFLLSRYTKKFVTVVLTGEGSDEIFGGYPQYKFMKMRNNLLIKNIKHFANPISSISKKIPPNLLNFGFRFASELGEKGIDRFNQFLSSDKLSNQYLNLVSLFNEEEKKELLNFKPLNLYEKFEKDFNKKSILNHCMAFDFNGSMVEDLLMKLDKNAMAFSLEGRVPFLDNNLVALMSRAPERFKLKGFNKDKFILRNSFPNLVPKPTANRKKKHFFVPINDWLESELSGLRKDLFSEKYLKSQGIFNPNYFDKILKGFKNSRLFYSRQLWSLLTFQIWYKQFIENEKIKI